MTGALHFSKWIELGEDFLIKSNINNWLTCSPNGGSLSGYKHGAVNCKITKVLVPCVCEDVVPHLLLLQSSLFGPALFARAFCYYFDVSSSTNWPVVDPCGTQEQNHLKNVQDPSGWIYLRESAAAESTVVNHIHNDSNLSGKFTFYKKNVILSVCFLSLLHVCLLVCIPMCQYVPFQLAANFLLSLIFLLFEYIDANNV